MPYEKIKKILSKSCIPLDYVSDLKKIYSDEEYKDAVYVMVLAFMYGVVIGKREERARKRGKVHE